MKFLKVLINSLISSIFFSFLIALLVLDLNINLTFSLSYFIQLALFIAMFYGLLITFLSILIFFSIQYFSSKKINIAIVSPAFLIISFTILTLLFLVIFRENYHLFLSFFIPETINLLKTQFITLIFLSVLGILASIGYFKYKRKLLFALLYFCLFAAAITYAAIQRANFPLPKTLDKIANLETKEIDKKATIIGMEGLSLDFIIPLTSEEKLPNFSWLMEEGSWGKLKSITPNEPLILNSSFNTGKLPAKHRKLSWNEYTILDFKQRIQVTPRYIFFRQLTRTGLLKSSDIIPKSFSKNIWDIFDAKKTPFLRMDSPYRKLTIKTTAEAESKFNHFFKDLRFETLDIFNLAKKAFCLDVQYETEALLLKEQKQPRLFYFLLPGLNIAETYFYKYAFPELFGEVNQEDINKFRYVIERYYQYYDEIIGRYLAAKKDDELLIIFSPYGTESLPLWKRYLEWILGNPEVSAYHEKAPDGVVFFIGKDITKGKYIEDMKLIDIAPTLLHYLGLPVGKNIDGIVNSSIFTEEFKNEPVLYISSYEEHEIKLPK